MNDLRAATIDLIGQLAAEWRDHRVSGLAAEVAFFGMLSVFPTLLVIASALGSLESVVGRDVAERTEAEVLDFLRRVLTDRAGGTIDEVQRLFEGANPGVFTVGAMVALWTASRAFVAVVSALNAAYDVHERRSWPRLRGLGLLLALGNVVVVSLVVAMVVVGPLLGTGLDVAGRIGLGGAFATFWDWARWPTVLAITVAWATTVFHFAPSHRTRWRWDLPGAAFAAAAWIVVSLGFRIYLSYAGSANQVFGALGGALIALVWFYLLAVGLLLGGELNSILSSRFRARLDERTASRPSG